MERRKQFFSLGWLLCFLSPLHGWAVDAPSAAAPAAMVNGIKISKAEVMQKIGVILKKVPSSKALTPEETKKLFDMVLQQLIQETLLSSAADSSKIFEGANAEGLIASENQTDEKNPKPSSGSDLLRDEKALAKVGVTMEKAKEISKALAGLTEKQKEARQEYLKSFLAAAKQLKVQYYVRSAVEEFKNIPQEELDKEVAAQKDMKTVIIQTVVVKDKDTAERFEKALKQTPAKAEVQFKTLSQKYGQSDDKGQKYQEIERPLVALENTFRQLLEGMNPGDIKIVPDGAKGFVIFRLKSKTVPTAPNFVKSYCQEKILRAKIEKFMEDLTKAAKIEVFNEDGKARPFSMSAK